MSEVLHIVVSGRVQGVGFRYHTEKTARGLGIAGWVRNLPGGEVEVTARVTPANKAAFLAALRRGPPMSQGVRLRIDPARAAGECPERGFTVRF